MFLKYNINIFEIKKQSFEFLDKIPLDTKIIIIIMLFLLIFINIGDNNDIE